MRAKATILGVAALWLAAAAAAQTTVEAVQYPAWLERGGQRAPLVPGTVLQAKDRIATGGNARAQLRLPEGSAVKLGENARFVVERVEHRAGALRAVLNVLDGAFRFTTAQARRRDVAIQVKNVTAGIRGTDLWGKSTDERDLVCLIEGRISVQSEGNPAVTLDTPLDFYQLPRGGKPEVSKVTPEQLAEWARETEIPPDGATARASGAWRVVAGAFPARDRALALGRTLRARGFPTETVEKEKHFLVQIPGLAAESDARALLGAIRDIPGVDAPHIRQGR